MTDKELQRLKRIQLVDILIEQDEEILNLRTKLQSAETRIQKLERLLEQLGERYTAEPGDAEDICS